MSTSGRLATTIGIERTLEGNWSAKLASRRCHDRDWNEPMQNRRERISVNPAVRPADRVSVERVSWYPP